MIRALHATWLIAVAAACGCRAEPDTVPIPGPGPGTPVTAKRLTGARLVEIRDDPPIEWTFTATRFAVACRTGPLPADVAGPLLGTGSGAARIEGAWRLDEGAGQLVLSDMSAPERSRPESRAALPIRPAGTLRCDLGERQYNVFEGDEKR